MSKDYTSTMNLPRTDFPMRANLPEREPEMLKYWESIDLYHKMLKANEGGETFVLHDGPPFSNGNIHMGTALNKVLKDIINKSKTMEGYRTPYIPGWDNHGMPIESAIIKKNKLDRKRMTIPEFRYACQKFAEDYVNIQRNSFIRLGVTGDWEHPYLTMSPEFEAREVKVFGEMYRRGSIYKGLKPVYWCPHDETALAEAEIEYSDDKCTSVFVKFRVTDDKGLLSRVCSLSKTYFIIWTTTIWTLPGNLAIALAPDADYAVVKTENGETYIVAEALVDSTMSKGGVGTYETVMTMKGREFEFMKAAHPFLDRESVILNADYVTMDSGTGCVHTAPGFGADDYLTCKKYGMEMIVPVDDKGYQTAEAGKFAGIYYEDSNTAILEDMQASGALFASEEITHSYPHCWRCKHPIIFRATPQWFCSVESFKDKALAAADKVEWMPSWGGDRIKSMICERSDWCISRQRHWGLPIPVFYCSDCGRPVCTDETINAVSDMFGRLGSNSWFEKSAEEILPEGFVCPHCGGGHFTKETDTLDGWFDSGSSHFAVLENKEGLHHPADLYLEGADQYRGWFQSSLLTSVGAGADGSAPYRAVLTHGWTVDGEGRAMHKSLGNTIAPEDIIKKYGADIVRLWVASSDYTVDVRVSEDILKQLSESYRKIRNTCRILMANISDFNPDTDAIPYSELYPIDKWVVSKTNDLTKSVREAYDRYEFHVVEHAIINFCTITLSKLYIDITKDRAYTEGKHSVARRSVMTAMYTVLSSLTRLFAPLLAFTGEEVWQAMPHAEGDSRESVFCSRLPEYDESLTFPAETEHYDSLFLLRDDVMKALEEARAAKKIGKSLDAKVTIYARDDETAAELESFTEPELEDIFIVSHVKIEKGLPTDKDAFTGASFAGLAGVLVEGADGERCDRCWKYSTECQHGEDGGTLCPRCREVVAHG
ncbi:MAG: isoleucine--tRNA ligase [Clostridia bacterium]|nr:isoleucine--tRNA ligase [Clostridia bacterium]